MAKLIPFPRNPPPPEPLEPPRSAQEMPLTRGERVYHAGVFSFLVMLSLPLFACLMWAGWLFVIVPILGTR